MFAAVNWWSIRQWRKRDLSSAEGPCGSVQPLMLHMCHQGMSQNWFWFSPGSGPSWCQDHILPAFWGHSRDPSWCVPISLSLQSSVKGLHSGRALLTSISSEKCRVITGTLKAQEPQNLPSSFCAKSPGLARRHPMESGEWSEEHVFVLDGLVLFVQKQYAHLLSVLFDYDMWISLISFDQWSVLTKVPMDPLSYQDIELFFHPRNFFYTSSLSIPIAAFQETTLLISITIDQFCLF